MAADDIARRQRHRGMFDDEPAAGGEPTVADHAERHGVRALLAQLNLYRLRLIASC